MIAVLHLHKLPIHWYGSLALVTKYGEQKITALSDTLTAKQAAILNKNDLLAKYRVGDKKRGFDSGREVVEEARRQHDGPLIIYTSGSPRVIHGDRLKEVIASYDSLPAWGVGEEAGVDKWYDAGSLGGERAS